LNTGYSGHSVLYKVENAFKILVSMVILKLELHTIRYNMINAFALFSTINNNKQLIPYIVVRDIILYITHSLNVN